MDEIPVAVRQRKKTVRVASINLSLRLALWGLAMVGPLLVVFARPTPRTESSSSNTTTQLSTEKLKAGEPKTTPETSADAGLNPDERENQPEPEHILGHLPYPEASLAELKPITSDGSIKLRAKAAEKFLAMQAAARASGVILLPISGFRSISQQEYLFFKIKEQRAQVASQRAEVSAPPGYSEHHTGYAVDMGDGRAPATNLSPSFDRTAAYQWLAKNAAKYSFELSFTQDNLQGISYEPWHWRYVGDTHSLETFYKARNLKAKINKQQLTTNN
jgi:D-alanyl-D-alanine carboxypeptidase